MKVSQGSIGTSSLVGPVPTRMHWKMKLIFPFVQREWDQSNCADRTAEFDRRSFHGWRDDDNQISDSKARNDTRPCKKEGYIKHWE